MLHFNLNDHSNASSKKSFFLFSITIVACSFFLSHVGIVGSKQEEMQDGTAIDQRHNTALNVSPEDD
jgi:hypothetical protein